jgi:hypothetical protein
MNKLLQVYANLIFLKFLLTKSLLEKPQFSISILNLLHKYSHTQHVMPNMI